MKNPLIKIIKRTDGEAKTHSPAKKPGKKRSIEGTIQNWITECRENVDTENRTLNSKFATINSDSVPAEAI